MFRNYLFNGVRRLAGQAPYWIVPLAIGRSHFLLFLFGVLTVVVVQAMERSHGLRALIMYVSFKYVFYPYVCANAGA